MALKIWLTLRGGSLKNLGLDSSVGFNVVGSTTQSGNATGGVYTDTGIFSLGTNLEDGCFGNTSFVSGGILSNSTINLGQKHSMFCWFKFTTLNNNSSLGAGLVTQHRYENNRGTGITIKYVSSTTGYLSVNTGNGSSRTYNTYCGTTLLQANTWYHGGFTYDGRYIRIYVNGVCEKVQEYPNMSVVADNIALFCWSLKNNSTSPHPNYKLNGFLNDVRIYDNCITDYDVKRISRVTLFDFVPYSGAKNVFFDRSGTCIMPMDDSNAVFKGDHLYFNGDANIYLGPKKNMKGTFGLTSKTLISVWFSITALPQTNRIMLIDPYSKKSVGFTGTNSYFLLTSNGLSSNVYNGSGNLVLKNSLNNVIAIYDENGPQMCYVNGVEVSSVSTSTNYTESYGFKIGGRQYNTSSNFIGNIYNINIVKLFREIEPSSIYKAGPFYRRYLNMFLPNEYERLEYIKSTGTQWINTQYVPGAGTKLKVRFKQDVAQTTSTYYPISCVRANDNKLLLECFIKQLNLYALSVAGSEFTGTYAPATSMLNIELSMTKVVINGEVVRTGSTVSVTNTRPLFLFAYNKDGNSDTTRYMSCNLYEAKIYEIENGLDILKLNLVPAKRKSDSVYGLYDTISRQFFTNSGTGSFTGA